jgi:uncharacterized membrane protein YeaQ/YmgE (transglycosylase-associated protein family)
MRAMTARKSSPRNKRSASDPEAVDSSCIEILPPDARLPVDWRPLVATALVGMAGGWVASLLVGGSGLLRYLVTGVIGALAAEHVSEKLGWRISVGHAWLDKVLVAALGAIAIVLLARWIA